MSTALRDAALFIACIPRKDMEAQIESRSSRSRLNWGTRILAKCRVGEATVILIALG